MGILHLLFSHILASVQSSKLRDLRIVNSNLVSVTHTPALLTLSGYKLVCPNGNWVIGVVFNYQRRRCQRERERDALCAVSLSPDVHSARSVYIIILLCGSIQRQINKSGSSEKRRVLWFGTSPKYAAEWVTENRSLILQTPVSLPFVSADDQAVRCCFSFSSLRDGDDIFVKCEKFSSLWYI